MGVHGPGGLPLRPRVCEGVPFRQTAAVGTRWCHLRICMSLRGGHGGGAVNCEESHAPRDHEDTRHPIARSMEPGETWGWCFVDRTQL